MIFNIELTGEEIGLITSALRYTAHEIKKRLPSEADKCELIAGALNAEHNKQWNEFLQKQLNEKVDTAITEYIQKHLNEQVHTHTTE